MGGPYSKQVMRRSHAAARSLVELGSRLGLNDDQIAKEAGVSRETVARYRRGIAAPMGCRRELILELIERWKKRVDPVRLVPEAKSASAPAITTDPGPNGKPAATWTARPRPLRENDPYVQGYLAGYRSGYADAVRDQR